MKTLLAALALLTASLAATAQAPKRLSAHFSLKHISATGEESLTIGNLYYDMRHGQLIYRVQFPDTHTVVVEADSTYVLRDSTVVSASKTLQAPNATVFHMALIGQLNSYGLAANPSYSLTEQTREGDCIISTWEPQRPPGQRMALLHCERQLRAVLTYNTEGEVATRQQFSSYTTHLGTAMPREVLQTITLPEGTVWLKLELKEVSFDEGAPALYHWK